MNAFFRIGLCIGVTALLGGFSSYQFTHSGSWLPGLPPQIGLWEAIETPVPSATLALLGNPQAAGFEYVNPLGDRVQVSLVAAGPFENYHDPTVCVGGPAAAFTLTAKRNVRLDATSKAEARAMVFQNRRNKKLRIIMYYWQQNRDGSTSTAARMGNYRDIQARFETGFGAVVLGHQTVLLRIYAPFLEDQDPKGVHTQNSVHEISQAIHRALLESGKGG